MKKKYGRKNHLTPNEVAGITPSMRAGRPARVLIADADASVCQFFAEAIRIRKPLDAHRLLEELGLAES